MRLFHRKNQKFVNVFPAPKNNKWLYQDAQTNEVYEAEELEYRPETRAAVTGSANQMIPLKISIGVKGELE